MAHAIGRATCFSLGASGRAWLRDLQWIRVGARGCVFVKYVVCGQGRGGLTSRSRPLSGQLTFCGPRSPCARSVSQPSSANCLASVIKGLRREEAGQATVFSKRAFSHFLKTASGAAQLGDFYHLCTSSCPCFIRFDYPFPTHARDQFHAPIDATPSYE